MMKIPLFVLCLFAHKATTSETDNSDLPRTQFEYEYKVLGKLSEQEHELVALKEANVAKDLALQQLYQEIQDQKEHMKTWNCGSTYTRWGRTICPDNGTEMVYKGFTGGSSYSHKGSASNTLCLPDKPTWGEYNDALQAQALVYGTEYETSSGPFADMMNHEVPCAVCKSNRPTMIMIPGRTNCTDSSWTMEYSGYLMAEHYNYHSSEYICIDGNPEAISKNGNTHNTNGNLLYYVESRCGSLPCPPYTNGRELACVVCTQ